AARRTRCRVASACTAPEAQQRERDREQREDLCSGTGPLRDVSHLILRRASRRTPAMNSSVKGRLDGGEFHSARPSIKRNPKVALTSARREDVQHAVLAHRAGTRFGV